MPGNVYCCSFVKMLVVGDGLVLVTAHVTFFATLHALQMGGPGILGMAQVASPPYAV